MDLREWTAAKQKGQRHPWELARLEVVKSLLRRHVGKNSDKVAVLDFGGGDLFVAKSLAAAFPSWNVDSVDSAFTPQIIAQLKLSVGSTRIRAFNSLNQWQGARPAPARVALMLDVLEHCENEQGVLGEIGHNPAVGEDCLWVLTVPAFQMLYTRHDEFLGHYRRYTRTRLVTAVKKQGLSVLESGYFFSSLLLPRALQKISESFGFGKNAQQKGLGEFGFGPAVARVVTAVLFADFWFSQLLGKLGLKLPGLSCYVVARGKSSASAQPRQQKEPHLSR